MKTIKDDVLIIAIDPATRMKGCGVATYSNNHGYKIHTNMNFAQAFHLCVYKVETMPGKDIVMFVETYRTKRSFRGGNSHIASANVGMGIAAMKIMKELAVSFWIPIMTFYPKDTEMCKKNTSEFKRLTGYSGRSSADGRCAMMMIWNYINGLHSPVEIIDPRGRGDDEFICI
jgi:hypothetical protein